MNCTTESEASRSRRVNLFLSFFNFSQLVDAKIRWSQLKLEIAGKLVNAALNLCVLGHGISNK